MVRQRRENIESVFLGFFTDELNEHVYEQLSPMLFRSLKVTLICKSPRRGRFVGLHLAVPNIIDLISWAWGLMWILPVY